MSNTLLKESHPKEVWGLYGNPHKGAETSTHWVSQDYYVISLLVKVKFVELV
jgi:hypothetical protein